jgi:SAM-dependent methyltransferase
MAKRRRALRTSNPCPWEQPSFRRVVGCELRPGGLGLTGEAAEACRLRPGDRVLDVGCGVGATAEHLAGSDGVRAIGLDSSGDFLNEAALRTGTARWVRGEAGRLPFREGVFDAAFCECVLSLVDAPLRVLGEAARVLRPKGRLALTDVYVRTRPARPDLEPLSPVACLRGARAQEAVLAEVEAAGFRVLLWQDRSAALKTLAARLVFACESVEEYRRAFSGGSDGTRPRLGYYLLVAER